MAQKERREGVLFALSDELDYNISEGEDLKLLLSSPWPPTGLNVDRVSPAPVGQAHPSLPSFCGVAIKTARGNFPCEPPHRHPPSSGHRRAVPCAWQEPTT